MMDDNISLLKTIEKTYTNNELIEILVYKKNEIDSLFQESSEELDRIGREKDELNKLEENVRYELSGLHGARTVLDQLINDNSVKTKQENEEQ
jgi:hypothetical protein|tara:strand:+ start:122 stop:400 length:279 start_codon:yes stop_codon:yes gene_type:complete